MSDRAVPRNWTQLSSWEQIQRWSGRGGLMAILDDPTDHPDCDPRRATATEAVPGTTAK